MKKLACETLIMCLLFSSAVCGCREKPDRDISRQQAGKTQQIREGRIKIKVGQTNLWVEVADRPDSREQGLMFRKILPGDEGMLFIFDYPQMQSFWMKNTYLPLDIAFVSKEGRIINILTMKPLDEDPRYRSVSPAQYVIEANAGWFENNGIKAGDRVEF